MALFPLPPERHPKGKVSIRRHRGKLTSCDECIMLRSRGEQAPYPIQYAAHRVEYQRDGEPLVHYLCEAHKHDVEIRRMR